MVFEAFSRTGCFTACIDLHLFVIDLDNAIRFNNVPGPFKGVWVPVA